MTISLQRKCPDRCSEWIQGSFLAHYAGRKLLLLGRLSNGYSARGGKIAFGHKTDVSEYFMGYTHATPVDAVQVLHLVVTINSC